MLTAQPSVRLVTQDHTAFPVSARLDLPLPPSVNTAFATDWKTKRRFKSKAYTDWITAATLAMGGNAPMLDGPVVVKYTFTKPKNKDGSENKTKRDLGNLEKPVSDFLVKMSVIEDDSLIQRMTLCWGDTAKGCLVEIERANDD